MARKHPVETKTRLSSYACLLNKFSTPELWGIQSQGNTDFTGGNNINRDTQIFKDGKDLHRESDANST